MSFEYLKKLNCKFLGYSFCVIDEIFLFLPLNSGV